VSTDEPGLGHGEALVAERRLDRAADARDEVVLGVLHVGEDLGDRIAFDHVLHAVVVSRELHVDGVGVAEEVVEVA
jgi:hypothetical protein